MPTWIIAPGFGSCQRVDHPQRVLQDRPLVLDQRIRRQPALALADRHPAAGRVKAQPDLGRGLDRVFDAGAVGEQIEMVRRGGAAGKRQLDQPGRGRDAEVVGPHPRPDRIERLQPAEQRRVLRLGHRAGQGLEQVVMGVDQARRDHAAVAADDLGIVGIETVAHRLDHAAAQHDIGAMKLGADVVHRHHRLGVLQQPGLLHPPASPSSLQRSTVQRPVCRRKDPPALYRRAAFPVGYQPSGGLDHRDRGQHVIGMQPGLDHQIGGAHRHQRIAVAVEPVAGQPHPRRDPAEGGAFLGGADLGEGREQPRLGQRLAARGGQRRLAARPEIARAAETALPAFADMRLVDQAVKRARRRRAGRSAPPRPGCR